MELLQKIVSVVVLMHAGVVTYTLSASANCVIRNDSKFLDIIGFRTYYLHYISALMPNHRSWVLVQGQKRGLEAHHTVMTSSL